MSTHIDTYPGRRISYDGALCTVRCQADSIPGTKGQWLGVEWDDLSRGKHNGTYNGVKYFRCQSTHPTAASFVRPTRKQDPERTVLEAIKFKYVADQSSNPHAPVVISGKVAEEVGFDKIIKAQSELGNLKIAILDSLTICGVASRGSNADSVRKAQEELALACPNVVELDLSHNPIETWADVEEICIALPKLRVLRVDIRLRDLTSQHQTTHQKIFQDVRELHLNECLISLTDVVGLLGSSGTLAFPALESLWLSQNEISSLDLAQSLEEARFERVRTVMLENNLITSLDPLVSVFTLFPFVSLISLQSNRVSSFGSVISSSDRPYASLLSLNLSANEISSFSFVDSLPRAFPNMSALRISGNPVYSQQQSTVSSSNRTDISYYLTLARIPKLRSLNYTDITTREREEGEIYYLSVAEKDIRNYSSEAGSMDVVASNLVKRYPQYDTLCKKHDRDNLITQLTSPTSTSKLANPADNTQSAYPPGSLASRIITSSFTLADTSSKNPSSTAKSFNRPIPSTVSTSSVFGVVSRELNLPPLSFRLVYESEELDPARDDLTTRSQLYAAGKKGEERWDEWGDWDADAMIEASIERKKQGFEHRDKEGDGKISGAGSEGKWTEDGVLIKDGRKWMKREVDVLFGMKSWGDWLERGVRSCKIRVERVHRNGVS